MYRILIADDEQEERNVIRYLLNKYQFPLEITEAANGKEALSILQNESIHILFTDIKMPFITGMELATETRNNFPEVQIIFFSGFDDFDYVKEALSLRAVNYILKPVNPIEFQKTISSVIEYIQQREQTIAHEKANIDIMKNHLLYQLVNGTSFDTIKKNYSYLDLSFLLEYKRLFLLQFESDFFGTLNPNSDVDAFWGIINSLLPTASNIINLNPSQSLIFFNETLSLDIYINLALKLNSFIYTTWNRECYISVSESFSNPEELEVAFQQTEIYLENRFFCTNQYVFSSKKQYITENISSEQDDQLLKAIERDIHLKDTYSLNQNIQLILDKYEKQANNSHIYIRFLCTNLLKLLLQSIPDYDKNTFQFIAEKVYSLKRFSEIHSLIEEILEELNYKLSKEQQSPKHAVHLVEQYIQEHYSEELSLNILAEKVFLTPRYLSSMFIQETGCGINKYIKTIRMERSKELLQNTNIKVADICESVGYSNVSYFCKSFQENFGTTPDKFRQNSI